MLMPQNGSFIIFLTASASIPPLLSTVRKDLSELLTLQVFVFSIQTLSLSMSLPILPPKLPLEIRSRIYEFNTNKSLALVIPEIFWAIAPDYFRVLTLGRKYPGSNDLLQTRLVRKYPTSGNFVERLVIYTDPSVLHTLKPFLDQFPPHRNLDHLCIAQSSIAGSFCTADQLPFLKDLEKLIESSPKLARISFHHLNPTSTLIHAAGHQLTRLDIGKVYPTAEEFYIPLPPTLLILMITPLVVPKLIYHDARNLQTLVIRACDYTYGRFTKDIQDLVLSCPALTNVGIIDICKSLFFFSFFFYCLFMG